jgi:ferredoxin
MAYWIDSGCTACGECLPKCPNDAISKGTPIYRIEPLLCTECVGYEDAPQCVDVCPEGAIHLAAGPWNLLADGLAQAPSRVDAGLLLQPVRVVVRPPPPWDQWF